MNKLEMCYNQSSYADINNLSGFHNKNVKSISLYTWCIKFSFWFQKLLLQTRNRHQIKTNMGNLYVTCLYFRYREENRL